MATLTPPKRIMAGSARVGDQICVGTEWRTLTKVEDAPAGRRTVGLWWGEKRVVLYRRDKINIRLRGLVYP